MSCFGRGCMAGIRAEGTVDGIHCGDTCRVFGVRPFFLRHCYRESSAVRTNVDALIGKTGRVIEPIDNRVGSGRVLVGGDDWKAVSVDGVFIDEGTAIEVVKLEGTRLYVRSI